MYIHYFIFIRYNYKNKEGQEFNALISGVTEFGMFVELEDSLCEGLVSIRDIKDDHYVLNKESYSLIGRKTRNGSPN